MSRFLDIDVAQIAVRDRLRALDPDWVKLIAASIDEVGLRAPIVVAKSGDKYHLVAGLHRLEAVRTLGRTSITAEIVEKNELKNRLVEIDENLMRRDLSELDRGAFLAERQDVYLQLHAETARGKAGATARWHANEKLSFASSAAEKLGVSERLIQLSIKRYRSISPDVREKIANTKIAANGAALDALARSKNGAVEQRKIVGAMLRATNPCRSVADARVELGFVATPKNKTGFDALLSAWRKAKAKERIAFLEHLEEARELERFVERPRNRQ